MGGEREVIHGARQAATQFGGMNVDALRVSRNQGFAQTGQVCFQREHFDFKCGVGEFGREVHVASFFSSSLPSAKQLLRIRNQLVSDGFGVDREAAVGNGLRNAVDFFSVEIG